MKVRARARMQGTTGERGRRAEEEVREVEEVRRLCRCTWEGRKRGAPRVRRVVSSKGVRKEGM